MNRRRSGSVALAVAVFLLAGCPHFRPSASNPLSQTIDVEREMELGAEFHAEARKRFPFVTDPIVLDYVNGMGQQIVRVTEPQPFIYRFSVIRDRELNAFAVPGGYIYLHSGVLASAGNAAELAGVLAHEVAHVRKRHIARSRENAQMRALIAGLAAAALAQVDPAAAAIPIGLNVAIDLKYSRTHEDEADREGRRYMVKAGYQPQGMVRFFERIQTRYGAAPDVPAYLFTHPAIPDRIRAGRIALDRMELPAGLMLDDGRLAQIQSRLAAILEPVAGGTGLQARASFDRLRTDPYLERAQDRTDANRLQEAAELLAEAAALEPRDPRVPLEQADVAEARGDVEAAAEFLRRAFELDPSVSLVQYRLGVMHKRLGNRSAAVFYLEQAAASYSPGSQGQRRAEFELRSLSFPVLVESGLSGSRSGAAELFTRGESITWWGEIARHFGNDPPPLALEWIDPTGRVAFREEVRMEHERRVESTFRSDAAPSGEWSIRVHAGESVVERRSFRIELPGPAS